MTKAPHKTENLNFGEALELLKQGFKIQRKGWNGKNMFLVLESNFKVKLFENPRMEGYRNFEPAIVMFTADKKWQPGWLASQPDMLSSDWQVVNL